MKQAKECKNMLTFGSLPVCGWLHAAAQLIVVLAQPVPLHSLPPLPPPRIHACTSNTWQNQQSNSSETA